MQYFLAYKNLQSGTLSIVRVLTVGRSRSVPAPEQRSAEFRLQLGYLFYSDHVFFLTQLLSFFLPFSLACFVVFFIFSSRLYISSCAHFYLLNWLRTVAKICQEYSD